MAEPMKVCIDCKEEYEPLRKGGILLHVCPECRAKPKAPSPWQARPSGLVVLRDVDA